MKICLDVCCLNRPFDDQSQERIHLEAESILIILKLVEDGKWRLLNSDTISYKVSRIPDAERRAKVNSIISMAKEHIQIDENVIERAKQIQKLGVKGFDALHVACSEKGKADIFLTTDDQLLKKLHQRPVKVKVRVSNPLDWIREVI